MSKGNSAVKVLRTALKRVQKGWTQHVWYRKDPETGQTFVCLEGALYGYCSLQDHQLTPAMREARDFVIEIIKERYDGRFDGIPAFNDNPKRTQEEVEEVTKLALIRAETSGGDDEASNEEDFNNLLEFMDS